MSRQNAYITNEGSSSVAANPAKNSVGISSDAREDSPEYAYVCRYTSTKARTKSEMILHIGCRKFAFYLLMACLITFFLAVLISYLVTRNLISTQLKMTVVSTEGSENDLPYELKLVRTLNPCNGGESLVAQLDRKLFVACGSSNITHVYDSITLDHQQEITIPNLRSPNHMVVNPIYSMIYLTGLLNVDYQYRNATTRSIKGGYAIWKADVKLNTLSWEFWMDSVCQSHSCKMSVGLDGRVIMANITRVIYLDSLGGIADSYRWFTDTFIYHLNISRSESEIQFSHALLNFFVRPDGTIILHIGLLGSRREYLVHLEKSASENEDGFIGNYLNTKVVTLLGRDEGSLSVTAVGPKDYLFYASCAGLARIEIMDWKRTKSKVVADYDSDGLICITRSMSYDPETERLAVGELPGGLWKGIVSNVKGTLKIFDVIANIN